MNDAKPISFDSADGGRFRVRPMPDCGAILIQKNLHHARGEVREFFVRPADLPQLIAAMQEAAVGVEESRQRGNSSQTLSAVPTQIKQ